MLKLEGCKANKFRYLFRMFVYSVLMSVSFKNNFILKTMKENF